MRKDLVIGAGVGIPVVILMILVGGGGHTSLDFEDNTVIEEIQVEEIESIQPSQSFEEEKVIVEEPKIEVEIIVEEPKPTVSSEDCSGTAQCIAGIVTKIIDGDTIHVDDQSVRFALSSAPELSGYGGTDARNFIQTICPVGSSVLVDEDDSQTSGSYGRLIGVIYCNGVNLNSELLDAGLGYMADQFCDSSEFAEESWAQKHGCMIEEDVSVETISNCDPSYPDFCIPSSPPDLDCGDIAEKKFTVLQPDPHRFDADKDGIGCES